MKKLILALSIVLLPTLVLALPPKPAMCPDPMNIKLVGLSQNLARDSNGLWYAGRTSQSYGTAQNWTFVIGSIFANSQVDALAEAYEALATLVLNVGPIEAPSDKWLCLYSNNEGFPAGAITPPISS